MILQNNTNDVPSGFRRNYSAAANPMNDISKQIANQFETLTKDLKQTLNDNFKNQINASLKELKNEMESLVDKLISENNNKICHFVVDILRTQPQLTKPDEKTIDIISSRFNHHQMGTLSTKNLIEYINKLWK